MFVLFELLGTRISQREGLYYKSLACINYLIGIGHKRECAEHILQLREAINAKCKFYNRSRPIALSPF